MKHLATAIPVLLLLAVACKTPTGVPADPSFSTDIQTIFNNHCVACHGNSSPPAGYSLTGHAGATGAGSDTIPNVVPGNADSSKLYRRVTGTETPLMPAGQPALDTLKTATIRNWIDRGAKNN